VWRLSSIPTWAFGVAVALLSWQVGMHAPGPGLDASWNGGLAMATESGLQFGRDVVFSYGPLGFLRGPYVWFGDLSVLGLLFSAALYLGFCTALVWALRRSLPALVSAAAAFLAVAVLPGLEQSLLLAVLVSLALLERERSQRLLWAFVVGAASFAALEALIKLSIGPVIVAVFVLALIGARARPLQLAAFFAILAAELALLWLATGQSFAALPDFARNSWQIISGYSSAMLRDVDVPAWKVTLATIAAALITLGLVVATGLARFRDARARWCAVLLMAGAGFVVFKEGVVRTDAGHLSLYFSTACVLWIAIPWSRQRWPLLLAGAAVIAAIGIPVRPPGMPTNLDVVANLRFAGEQVGNLFSGSRRERLIEEGRSGMQAVYDLDPRMRAELLGRSVAIEPWEIGAAWAYRLDWEPLPVFQNYSAYTEELDQLNVAAVESPDGPERILRENPLEVLPEFDTRDLDNRYTGWDPPAQARAILCNFAPLATDRRWQVLGRVPDRCGEPRPLGSVEAGEGEAVRVPVPGRGEAVFVQIDGAGVSGLERLTTMLLHARLRTAILDGGVSYRLVPETAGDGLLLRADPRVVAGLGSFSPVPQTRTLAVEGGGGELRYDFYAVRVSGARRGP